MKAFSNSKGGGDAKQPIESIGMLLVEKRGNVADNVKKGPLWTPNETISLPKIESVKSVSALGSPFAVTAFTYTIAGTSGVTGLPRTAIYNLLAKGELVAKKAGRRTLVTAASIRQYLDSLPVATIGQSRSEKI